MSSRQDDVFVVEGVRAVASIMESPLAIRALIRIREAEGAGLARLEDAAVRRGVEVRRVDARHAKKYVATKSPQGIAAIVERPSPPDTEHLFAESRRVVVLDGLADPGNVGTLVRTAWLLGWDACVATSGGAAFFSEKVVRASAGAVGFLPLVVIASDRLRALFVEHGWTIALAQPGAPPAAKDAAKKIALVLGGEARGPISAWHGATPVGIPIRSSAVDSLGVVAGGAILLEAFRA